MVAPLKSAFLIKSLDRLQDAGEISARRSEVADIYPSCLIGSRALVGIRTRHGIVTLSLIDWNFPTAADFNWRDFKDLSCRSIGHIGPISLNVTMPFHRLNQPAEISHHQ
mgnify:FL=1